MMPSIIFMSLLACIIARLACMLILINYPPIQEAFVNGIFIRMVTDRHDYYKQCSIKRELLGKVTL